MKDIGYEVHRIMEANRMVKRKIAEKAGIDRTYLTQLRNKSDWSCSLLEKVSRAIGVAPSYFFDDFEDETAKLTGDIHNSSIVGNATVSVGNHGTDVDKLQKIIEHQERIIEQLMRMTGIDNTVKP